MVEVFDILYNKEEKAKAKEKGLYNGQKRKESEINNKIYRCSKGFPVLL
jgi:hypothetical protein